VHANLFASFNVTVTGPKARERGYPKEWRVVVRADEAAPRSIFSSDCWRHDGRVVLVDQAEGGWSNTFDMAEDEVVSVEPVIAGSEGCRDVP
jgi:hypothetical protein